MPVCKAEKFKLGHYHKALTHRPDFRPTAQRRADSGIVSDGDFSPTTFSTRQLSAGRVLPGGLISSPVRHRTAG